jgi:DNA polymerase lambda
MALSTKRRLVIVKRRSDNDPSILTSTPLPPLDFPLLDLRTCGGIGTTLETNQSLLVMFDRLIAYYTAQRAVTTGESKLRQGQRISSFAKARDAIRDCAFPVTCGKVAQTLKGIGKGIADRIDEYLQNGSLKELEADITPESRLIAQLCTVTGIGEVKATILVREHGVTSLDDLLARYRSGSLRVAKGVLTNHIAVGLEFYHDLQERFPWSEADDLAKLASEIIHCRYPNLVLNFCGSYRRKKETCGDLDVIVHDPVLKGSSPLRGIVELLTAKGFLVGNLTEHGDTLYMGVCRLPGGHGRRIDIRFVPADSVGAAMLYFTGSGKFNKVMRYMANQRGYTLNEYGLYTYICGVKGDKPIPAASERDIFDLLGFLYLEPGEREFGAS